MRRFDALRRWLFRWRSDGTAAIVLDRRRIYILPSRSGLLFAAALVVMLLGAINYNLALGHALVFLLAGIGMVGMVHGFRNLHGLRLTPGRCAPVFAGETAEFELLVDNPRPLARRMLVFAAVPGHPATLTVDGRQQAKIAIPLPSRRRGWLALPRVRLSTRYPLGLFTAWSYLQPEMRCLVYARPLATPLPEASVSAAPGSGAGNGGQEDFAGFRRRQPADPLRHVAWKASARDGGQRPLLVKQFAGGSETELALAWQATDPAQDNETRIAVLTGWVLEAARRQLHYSLALPGITIPAASGEAHCRRCLEALALLP